MNKKQKKNNDFNADTETKISTVKKQIKKLNEIVSRKKIQNNSMEEKTNSLFLKIWDSRQNTIIDGINNVICIILYLNVYFAYFNSISGLSNR